jgi:predicted RNA-binding Zn-ribbon protein involved in translation (DUF1610 family)
MSGYWDERLPKVYSPYMPIFNDGSKEFEEKMERDFPGYTKQKEELRQSKKEWKEKHRCCPGCGAKALIKTLICPVQKLGEPYRDDQNTFLCENCGLSGMVNTLVPEKGV